MSLHDLVAFRMCAAILLAAWIASAALPFPWFQLILSVAGS